MVIYEIDLSSVRIFWCPPKCILSLKSCAGYFTLSWKLFINEYFTCVAHTDEKALSDADLLYEHPMEIVRNFSDQSFWSDQWDLLIKICSYRMTSGPLRPVLWWFCCLCRHNTSQGCRPDLVGGLFRWKTFPRDTHRKHHRSFQHTYRRRLRNKRLNCKSQWSSTSKWTFLF